MFGNPKRPDPRDAEILFLRGQVEKLQAQVIALSDLRAQALLQQGARPHVPAHPSMFRPTGPQAIRAQGVRFTPQGEVEQDDRTVNESFKLE